ncbi:MAG: hypothetical protein PHW63_10775 [Alphaproteobacteria bacterium]|nr:hypothetical protein [Alphaproteobacteria bacterium]
MDKELRRLESLRVDLQADKEKSGAFFSVLKKAFVAVIVVVLGCCLLLGLTVGWSWAVGVGTFIGIPLSVLFGVLGAAGGYAARESQISIDRLDGQIAVETSRVYGYGQ